MGHFEENVFVEAHYYDGGFKTNFISDIPRPSWLPNPELVGIDNTLDLPRDGIVIEISRHKSESRHVTWIGAFVTSDDLVYGARSNYVGVGVWLTDYLAIAADKIVDALIKITWLIKKDGHAASLGPSKALLTGQGYLKSWIRPLQDLPDISQGVIFDNTGFPQASYIDAGVGNIDGATYRISTSLLVNQFSLDRSYQGSSRLVYIATQGDRATDVSKIGLKALADSNPLSQIFTYFSDSVIAVKSDAARAYQSQEDALSQLEYEKKLHADALYELEAARTEASRLNASASSIQTSRDQLQEQLRAMHLNTNLSDMAKAISDLSPILDDRVERDKLKRAMDYLIAQAKTSSSTRALGSSIAPRIALEGGQSSDINQIMQYISKINSNVSHLCSNRNAGKNSDDDNKIIRSINYFFADLKKGLSWYLWLLYPAGVVFLSILIVSSSVIIYNDLNKNQTELTKIIETISKDCQKESIAKPVYEPRINHPSLEQSNQSSNEGAVAPKFDSPTPSARISDEQQKNKTKQ